MKGKGYIANDMIVIIIMSKEVPFQYMHFKVVTYKQ